MLSNHTRAGRRWRRALLLGPVTLVITALTSVWITLGTAKVSMLEARNWEIVGVVLGALMLISSGIIIYVDRCQLCRAERDPHPDADTIAVGKRELVRAIYRFWGKLEIVLTLGTFAAARNMTVLHWLQRHPLGLYLLILNAVVCFTVLDFLDLVWRRAFNLLSVRK